MEGNMKVVIIGAGLSGLIAAGAFGEEDISLYDPSKRFDSHKAVMRLRNTNITNYIPCALKEINVTKGIFYQGSYHHQSNIFLNNLYSMKTYGSLGERSLSELGNIKRYLIQKIRRDLIPEVIKKRILAIRSNPNRIVISYPGVKKESHEEEYDVCISTIPMPTLLNMSEGIEYDKTIFKSTRIYVTIIHLDHLNSTVHQTLYYPEGSRTSYPYRATLQENKIIIESMSDSRNSDKDVVQSFGLNYNDVDENKIITYKQDMGKIIPIENSTRKKIMRDLSMKLNVYSFGRFAIWKPIRVDQALEDIERIKMLIDVNS